MTASDQHALPDVPSEFADEQLNDKLGIKLIESSPQRCVATMPVSGNLQPYGLLHGGANAVLAEMLGSVSAALNADGKPVVGLELSCTHHRGVREGTVTGVATPVHTGRSTSTIEIVLTDDQDRRTCTARLTCVTLNK